MTNPVLKFYHENGEPQALLDKIVEAFERLKEGHTVSLVTKSEIDELSQSNAVGKNEVLKPFILEGNRFYFQKYFRYETFIVDWINSRLETTNTSLINECQSPAFINLINKLFPQSDELDWQKIGAINCFIQSFSILSGGPGTGKTTTVAKFLSLFLNYSPEAKIALVAQTGKAATRLKDSINEQIDKLRSLGIEETILNQLEEIQPSTIHRLLKTDPSSLGSKFIHHQENPLNHDVILVDEASMIDLTLMYKLLNAIKPDCKVVLLGDKNQLSPVEAGSVFSDITSTMNENHFSNKLDFLSNFGLPKTHLRPNVFNSMVQLNKTYRFKEDSKIHEVSNKILNQNLSVSDFSPINDTELSKEGNVFLIQESELPDALLKNQIKFFETYIQEEDIEKALKNINDIRILCATNVGDHGVDNLNSFVEKQLSNKELFSSTNTFYHNQLLMVTKNDYSLGLFNGDVGIVRENEENELMFYIEDPSTDERYRAIPVQLIKNWCTSYAMTIHKSQGSQFKQVVIVLPNNENNKVLSKELLYTAITRSSHQVFIYSNENVLSACVNRQLQRATGIPQRLNQ